MDEDDLRDLIARATAVDGTPPFSDGALLELAQGKRQLVWETDETGRRIGAALDSPTAAEFVIDPDARGRGHGSRMLDMLTHPARHGAGAAKLFWAHGDHPAARILAQHHRLVAERTLQHLEAEVPATLPKRRGFDAPSAGSVGGGTGTARELRAFDAADADALVALNARVFTADPERGALTRADLDLLTKAPWFDREDLLLLHEGGEPIGFVWLKVDEFYRVGVSPEHQGRGLGRQLMGAGFARLASKGIRKAHLHVEDDAAAIALFRDLGFVDSTIDIQYHYTR